MRKWHIADQWLMRDGFEILSVIDDERGRSPIRFEQHVEPPFDTRTAHAPLMPSGLTISMDDAQQLMNELWRVGVRPRDGAGSLAQVEATKAHLEDMRRLVFRESPSASTTPLEK